MASERPAQIIIAPDGPRDGAVHIGVNGKFERCKVGTIKTLEPEFVEALGHAGVDYMPVSLAMSDFKNDEHTIGDVSKTIEEMWSALPAEVSLVADVGLEFDYAPGGTGSASASHQIPASAELSAAVEPALGCTAVIDVSLTSTTLNQLPDIQLGFSDDADFLVVAADMSLNFLGGGVGQIRSKDSADLFGVCEAASAPGRHRVALTLGPDYTAIAADGGDEVRVDPPDNFEDATKLFLYFYCFSGGAGQGRAIVEKVTFYPLQPPGALGRMSR